MSASAYVPRWLRDEVRERARGFCEYCRCRQIHSFDTFEIDHIIPRAAGGETVSENLCCTCPGFNSSKHDRIEALDPETKRRVPLFNPRRQHWKRHFRWSEDGAEIIGKTAVGRTTVEALRMNRPNVIAFRRLLAAFEVHRAE